MLNCRDCTIYGWHKIIWSPELSAQLVILNSIFFQLIIFCFYWIEEL